MKTLAIPTFGWPEWECDAFEQYVEDVAADFYANVTITHTSDYYFEIDLHDGDDAGLEYIILNAVPDHTA